MTTSIKKNIASTLSSTPKLKRAIKGAYRYIGDICSDKQSSTIAPLKRIGDKGEETFFGYYDKSPINSKGEWVAYHASTKKTNQSFSNVDNIKVVVENLQTNEIMYSKETPIFNWQQGSRLQWVSSDCIVFNTYDEIRNILTATIVNVRDHTEIHLPYGIYECISPDFYLTTNFAKISKHDPDYGYSKIDPRFVNLNQQDDGILKIENGKLEILYSYHQHNIEFSTLDEYCFNHLLANPSKSSFVFIERGRTEKGLRFDRLFRSDLSGEVSLISDSGYISHYCWVDDSTLLCFMRHKGVSGYYSINTETQAIKAFDHLSPVDGHPSFYSDSIVTDTYPDFLRKKQLILSNGDRNLTLGSIYEPSSFKDSYRCDLHPRINSNKIFIDSAHTGKRGLYYMELP